MYIGASNTPIDQHRPQKLSILVSSHGTWLAGGCVSYSSLFSESLPSPIVRGNSQSSKHELPLRCPLNTPRPATEVETSGQQSPSSKSGIKQQKPKRRVEKSSYFNQSATRVASSQSKAHPNNRLVSPPTPSFGLKATLRPSLLSSLVSITPTLKYKLFSEGHPKNVDNPA